MEITTLTCKQFTDIVYKNGSKADKRFVPVEHGGCFDYLDLSSSISNYNVKKCNLLYPAVIVNGIIVGLAELHKSPYTENQYWISFLSVDASYQGNGYGSMLVKQIFKTAIELGITIQSSSYSKLGWDKLKPVLEREAKNADVKFLDAQEKLFTDTPIHYNFFKRL